MPRVQRLDLIGQLDNPFDASEIDAFVLGQPLNLTEQIHVVLRNSDARHRNCGRGLTRPSRS